MVASKAAYRTFNEDMGSLMVRIDDSVITAQTLESRLAGERQVEICPRAKLTPSAHDFLRDQSIEVIRRATDGQPPVAAPQRSAAGVPAPAARRDSSRRDPGNSKIARAHWIL